MKICYMKNHGEEGNSLTCAAQPVTEPRTSASDIDNFQEILKAFSEHLRAKYGQLSDSTLGIVQDRQERG